jgi:Lrp/AsnC family leucine-responsive transcriptional regulator
METKFKLDIIDMKILSELDKNARVNLGIISGKIKKSKQLISYRIKNLEKIKVISGYNTVIDFSKLGLMSIRVYIKLNSMTPKKNKEFIEFLKKQKEIWWLMSVENICDIAYATLVKNINEFYSHLDKLSRYNKFIKSKQIVIYSHIKQYLKSYLIEEEKINIEILIGASMEKEEIDKTDFMLLKLISDNARISLIDLSVKLKIKPQSIVYRLRKLENRQIIKGYRVNINTNLLGFKNYKIYLNLIKNSKNKELENYCLLNPYIINTNKTIGGADFEIELQLKEINDLYKILDELREKFSDVIKDFEYGIAREEIKMIYFP